MTRRTWLDAIREAVSDLAAWLAALDWLTAGAFVLTIGSFLSAVLDSYTSLCLIGATQGHIGTVSACPDVGGWDTRTFPLSVDMGWGGALLAVVRLARSTGMGSWRWWVVIAFEVLTAAFTVIGNAYHGAVQDGATAGLHGALPVLISSVASAVPGVVAVGSGFTLSVLVSTPGGGQEGHAAARAEVPAEEQVLDSQPGPTIEQPPAQQAGRRSAREVEELVRVARAQRTEELGREPSAEEVAAQLTRDGYRITASRVRAYLARLRAEERAQPKPDEEVVAWHA